MVYATNPKARRDYHILETIEGGLVLFGHEVKSIKNSKVSLKGSYVKILKNEVWLIGAMISPYQIKNIPKLNDKEYDPQRTRKLLIKKSELNYIIGKSNEAGLTLIPLKLYSKKNLIKLEVGIARGKKKYDKRETIKKKEVKRKIQRALKKSLCA